MSWGFSGLFDETVAADHAVASIGETLEQGLESDKFARMVSVACFNKVEKRKLVITAHSENAEAVSVQVRDDLDCHINSRVNSRSQVRKGTQAWNFVCFETNLNTESTATEHADQSSE